MTNQDSNWESFFARLSSDDLDQPIDNSISLVFEKLTKFFLWKQQQNAEDLAMETVIRFFEIVSRHDQNSLDPIKNPSAYLYGIAKNIYREELRKKAKENSLKEDSLSEPLSYLFDPFRYRIIGDSFHYVDLSLALQTALDSLTEWERELLLSYYSDDISKEELAHRFGLSKPNLRQIVHRIKNKVRSQFRDERRGVSKEDSRNR